MARWHRIHRPEHEIELPTFKQRYHFGEIHLAKDNLNIGILEAKRFNHQGHEFHTDNRRDSDAHEPPFGMRKSAGPRHERGLGVQDIGDVRKQVSTSLGQAYGSGRPREELLSQFAFELRYSI